MEGLGREFTYSNEFIKSLFYNFPIPTYVWQRNEGDFILIDYNRAAKKVTYEKVEDCLYEKASIVHKDRPDIIASLSECIIQKAPISLETKYQKKTTEQEIYVAIRNYYIPPNLVIVTMRDLTQLKVLENKLIQSDKKYKMLFEDSPIAIVLLDLNGIIIDVNQTTEKVFGYAKEELLVRNYQNLSVYPIDLPSELNQIFSDLLKGESVDPREFQVYKKDKNKVWIHTELSLIKYEDKYLVQAFIFDITERKNFEQKIERMLEIERFLSKISSRFIGTDNIDGAINKSLLEMGMLIKAERAYILLYNEEDSLEFYTQEWCLEGIPPQRINPIVIKPNNYPWAQELYNKLGYIFIQKNSELPDSAGMLKEILNKLNIQSFLLFPIIIKGELYGFIGFDNFEKFQEWQMEEIELFRTSSEVIGNALERKWSEETLKGSHQLLAGIISSLTESICLIDYNFNVIWANNVCNQLFSAQITNAKCYKAFFQRGKPCENCLGFKTFSDGKIHEKEVEMKTIEGERLICWYTSSPAGANSEGDTEYAVLIFRDVTKSKIIEKSLKDSEQSLRQLTEHLKEKIEERTNELRQSEENYKRIINDLDVGFYKGKFKGSLQMHNSNFNRIMGIEPSISLIGAKATNFFIDLKTEQEYYNLLISDDYVKDFKAKIKRPDGTTIQIKLNSHLIRDNTGNPKEVEGTVMLIKDR